MREIDEGNGSLKSDESAEHIPTIIYRPIQQTRICCPPGLFCGGTGAPFKGSPAVHSGHPPRQNCFDRGQPLSWSSRCLRASHLGERRGEGGREGGREREREREKHTQHAESEPAFCNLSDH